MMRILAGLTHTPRHRSPRPATLPVDEAVIVDCYVADFARHAVMDGRTVADALTLAGIDADDRLTAVQVTS